MTKRRGPIMILDKTVASKLCKEGSTGRKEGQLTFCEEKSRCHFKIEKTSTYQFISLKKRVKGVISQEKG